MLVEAGGQSGENRRAIARRTALDRDIDMFETGLQRNPMPREQRQLRRAMRKPFERGHSVVRSDLANGVHPGMEVEWRNRRAAASDFGDSQGDLAADHRERIICHYLPPREAILSHFD
jgi:hypothetical protein